MKQQVKNFLAILLLLVVATACEKLVEPTPQFNPSNTTFTLSTPATTTVSVTATDSLKAAVTFTWNDANLPLGPEKTKYTLMFDKTGNNFLNPTIKEFTGVLSGALLGKEVNGIALKYDGNFTTPANLDLRVIASLANNNGSVVSNTIKVAFTPYSDLEIKSSVAALTATAATADNVGINLTWSTAFNGYAGVKTYQLQYAKNETNFAAPTLIDVTAFTKSFTVLELNKIALGYGASGATPAMIDFRIKATNELGTVLYSNTTTVAVTTYVAFNSIGIIGDATPGGWDNDTDMFRADPANKPADWSVTLYLIGGKKAKFRYEDKWDTNWGSNAFPSGTGTQGGLDIPISTSGFYKVAFNAGSGAYTFTPITTKVYTQVGLIGDQSSPAWSSEFANLTVSPENNQIWSGNVTLSVGEFKFRGNASWDFNWGTGNGGQNTDLSGWGASGGGNLKITTAGSYFVYINVATGEYLLGKTDRSTPYTDVGVIGDSTPGGWDTDTNLIRNPSNPYKWSGKIALTNKNVKFRANNGWDVNWGAATFPAGIGTANGPDIKVSEAGTYQINFNSATGEYSFIK